MTRRNEAYLDEFTYHSERARNEALAALGASDPRIAAIHVELATRHVRCIKDDESLGDPAPDRRRAQIPSSRFARSPA